jgi:uncharacterized protein with predicted RNA binding PUA domain
VILLETAFRRIRSVANYQFGKEVAKDLFPEKVEIFYSKRTGRIRYILLDGERLATLRPKDGLLALSIIGAKRIFQNKNIRCLVVVKNDVSKFIAEGGNVFAKHVIKVSDDVRPKDEVIVINGKAEVLAVGRAFLSGSEIRAFNIGVAIKTRHGARKKINY